MSASSPSSQPSCRAILVPTALLAVGLFLVPSAHALKGDANGDGQVNVQDARLVADYLVGNVLSIPRPADADVSGDGLVTTADALLILQFAKGLRTTFDFQSPLVLTVLPAVGSTNILLTANISVFFSEPISTNSLSGALTVKNVATGLAVPGRIERSQEGVIATFFPDQPLSPLTSYRVDVTTAVKDDEDNPLQQSFSGTFQTQALGTGVLVSTNNLSAPINELAPQPVVFKALSSSGTPVKQVPVTFTARMGSGVFDPSGKRQITVTTDDTGLARATFRVGGEAVVHTIEVGAIGFSAVPLLSIQAQALAPVNLRLYSGNNQNGSPGTVAPFPLVVQATDAGGNSIAGTPVTFKITHGQGNFGGQPEAIVPTNSSGAASALFTFGSSAGEIEVEAGFVGMQGQAPIFKLVNLIPQPLNPTTIVGRVIDAGTLKPLHRVYVYLVDTPTIWDWTDEDGVFNLTATPGSHVVSANGFESGPIEGRLYPVVAIPINVVEGQENDIGMPVLLPQLDDQSYIDVSEAQGGTLTLRSNPLWQLYVAPGQTRFANGTRTGRLYVASVPPDRIPMPVAGGKTSRFFDTIQPLNVVFDPPAQVAFPNADSLPAGTVTDIFTLSYTSGTFVRTGRGQVSEDGLVIRSLPGEGITMGGWHNAPDPVPPGTTCITGKIVSSNGGKGVPKCTITVGGQSGVTDGTGRYVLCNLVVNQPTVPIISCPKDSDKDGWCDVRELEIGTDPFNFDTDGDGAPDSIDPDPFDPDNKPTVSVRIPYCPSFAPKGYSFLYTITPPIPFFAESAQMVVKSEANIEVFRADVDKNGGQARGTWAKSSIEDLSDGTYFLTVEATYDGHTAVSNACTVKKSIHVQVVMDQKSYPNILYADGVSNTTVKLKATLFDDITPVEGETLNLEALNGSNVVSGSIENSVTTDVNGEAIANYTAPNLLGQSANETIGVYASAPGGQATLMTLPIYNFSGYDFRQLSRNIPSYNDSSFRSTGFSFGGKNGAEAVQAFLISMNSGLAGKSALELGGKLAKDAIWDAAQTSQVNPKIILVTLQKEASLIKNNPSPTANQLAAAMGCGKNKFPTFLAQVDCGARALGSLFNVPVPALGFSPTVPPRFAAYAARQFPGGSVDPVDRVVFNVGDRSTHAQFLYNPEVITSSPQTCHVRFSGIPFVSCGGVSNFVVRWAEYFGP